MDQVPKRTRICFSDIDGTLVHYHDLEDLQAPDVLRLHPSSTGAQGVISRRTLDLAAEVRHKGVKLVIVTGARTSTLLQRLMFLPQADAYVSENGGRIFLNDPNLPTAVPLVEDEGWRRVHEEVTGPSSQDGLGPLERKGTLWSWYRTLHEAGWKLDAKNYATAFRVQSTPGKTPEDMARIVDQRPPGINCSFNLGVADFYPATSGKEGAARYLMSSFHASSPDCVFLCDDDNDIPLAKMVHKAFLPSMTMNTIQEGVEADPEHFVVATKKGCEATEEMLVEVLNHFTDIPSPSREPVAKTL